VTDCDLTENPKYDCFFKCSGVTPTAFCSTTPGHPTVLDCPPAVTCDSSKTGKCVVPFL
jgi:hypothetical protein